VIAIGKLRFMLYIARWSEKVESAFVAAPPGEQHDARALVSMMLISLAGRTLGANYRLTLPMDKIPTDGVVLVTRRRRKTARCLIERKCEKISLGVVGPIST